MTFDTALISNDLRAARARQPAYDRTRLGVGIVHLGVGAFHRAHQAVFTEDAVAAERGDWGIVGVALQRPDTPNAVRRQQCLYTVETLSGAPDYRVVGVMKDALHAPGQPEAVLSVLAAPTTRVVTLTITEKGYCLGPGGMLDERHPDIVHDLAHPAVPRSAIGWLAQALGRRAQTGAGPITIISCDNVSGNGLKLGRAVRRFVEAAAPADLGWIDANTAFPDTMVDCIVPAATSASLARVARAIGVADPCCVQREPYSQWVIEDRFAAARPAWDAVGAQIVGDVRGHERLKLHILNACHSALAYLGLPLGFTYVREAIADPAIAGFLDAMVHEEIAPALRPLDAIGYWTLIRSRFANPMIDHELSQIACDGSAKLSQRIYPLLIQNARAGAPTQRLAGVVHAWLAFAAARDVADPKSERLADWRRAGASIRAALDDPQLFPDEFRTDPTVRAVLEARP